MLLLPPAHRGESPQSAVRRLLGGILLDPVSYIGVALIGFLVIQWLNGPCELVESPESFSGWDYEPPPWKTMPFCVVREDALQVLLWFVAVVSAVIAVRHAMRPSARYFILKLFVANGALLSILGFAQILTCPGKLFWYRPISVDFFSTFGYHNNAGTFFVMMTALNIGLLLRAIGNKARRLEITWLALALCLNAAGIYGSLCRAAIVMGSLVIVVGLVYGLIYLWNRISRIRVLAATVIIAAIAVCAGVLALVPGSPLKKEIDTIDFSHLASVYEGDREELAQTALEIWKDHSWTGVGGWGFRRYVALYMGEDRWEYLKTSGRANVHNDAIQFLCEHGVIGFGLMAALAIALLGHALVRLPLIRRETNSATGQPRSWFGSVSPCVWGAFAAIAAMAVHSTIDLPFRSIANTLVWFVLLACLPGFMPSKESSK